MVCCSILHNPIRNQQNSNELGYFLYHFKVFKRNGVRKADALQIRETRHAYQIVSAGKVQYVTEQYVQG